MLETPFNDGSDVVLCVVVNIRVLDLEIVGMGGSPVEGDLKSTVKLVEVCIPWARDCASYWRVEIASEFELDAEEIVIGRVDEIGWTWWPKDRFAVDSGWSRHACQPCSIIELSQETIT